MLRFTLSGRQWDSEVGWTLRVLEELPEDVDAPRELIAVATIEGVVAIESLGSVHEIMRDVLIDVLERV